MNLRKMQPEDRGCILEMMRKFYSSDAVLTNGSEEIFENDIDECISDSPFLEGFVFMTDGDIPKGYAMVSHSYNTEFGKPCIWIEDIYLEEELRGKGIASEFLDYLMREYPDAVQRLESEHENERAVRAYYNNGFVEIPYLELIRNK